MSRARWSVAVMFVIGVMSIGRSAQAQDVVPERVDFVARNFAPTLLAVSAATTFRLPEAEQAPLAPVVPQRPKPGGKSLLTSLYASTVAMQALDVHSTLRALNAGAVEGNPAMAGLTGNRGAFIATKAAVAAASIWAAHKISKKNRVAAIATLVAVNSAYAMIVSHNYRVAQGR